MLALALIIRRNRNQKQKVKGKYDDVPVDDLLKDGNIDTTSGAGASEPCVTNDSKLADISYDAPSDCLVKPRNGVCLFEDLQLVDGCCTLIKNENSDEVEIAISITAIVVTMAATEYAVQNAIKGGSKLAGKAIAKSPATRGMAARIVSKITGQTVAKVTAKLTASAASKVASKAAAKIASTAAVKAAWRVGVAAGMKASAKLTMTTVKASMGPVGWAMLAFDMVSIGLDVLDPQGYSTFVSNSYLMDMRDYMEFSLYEAFTNTNYGWPIIFDVKSMYFGEFVAAYETAKIPFIQQSMSDTLKCKTLVEQLDMESWFDEYTQRVLQYLNKDPKKRDEKIYAKMVELLGDNAKNIKLYPF